MVITITSDLIVKGLSFPPRDLFKSFGGKAEDNLLTRSFMLTLFLTALRTDGLAVDSFYF